jgi:hypothetical protein
MCASGPLFDSANKNLTNDRVVNGDVPVDFASYLSIAGEKDYKEIVRILYESFLAFDYWGYDFPRLIM